MPYADDDLERLLAGGHLSGRAYDEIEARVMQAVLPEQRRKSRFYWVLAAAVPAVAALGGLALYLGTADKELGDTGGFTAKGAESPLAGSVELRCSGTGGCRAGDTLHFLVNTDVAHGYLSASAQRIDPPSPERIHFFPTASGESPRLEPLGGTVVVDKAVRLGPSFVPGVYRVDIRFTDAAPSADPSAGRGTSVELRIDE